MSARMKKFRDRSNRIDLLLDDKHYEMLSYITNTQGSPNFSATIRALIRREYGKTYDVESHPRPGQHVEDGG